MNYLAMKSRLWNLSGISKYSKYGSREKRRSKVTRVCKSVRKKKNVKGKTALKYRKKQGIVQLHKKSDRRDAQNVQLVIDHGNTSEKTLTTEAFNVDYNKTVESITSDSRNQTTHEQHYGKRITFIVLLSTATTILLFAIMFAICKRSSCWSRIGKFHRPSYQQTSEAETSFKQCCTCIDESNDEINTSDFHSGSVTKCLKCWRRSKYYEFKSNAERTPLISARRKKKRKKKRRKKAPKEVQSSDETLNNDDLLEKRQRQTATKAFQTQKNTLQRKINQCVYRKNDPNCQCWKCREYVAMFHVWTTNLNRPNMRRELREYYRTDSDRLSYSETEDSSKSQRMFKFCPCNKKTCKLKNSRAGEKVCVHEMTDKK